MVRDAGVVLSVFAGEQCSDELQAVDVFSTGCQLCDLSLHLCSPGSRFQLPVSRAHIFSALQVLPRELLVAPLICAQKLVL